LDNVSKYCWSRDHILYGVNLYTATKPNYVKAQLQTTKFLKSVIFEKKKAQPRE